MAHKWRIHYAEDYVEGTSKRQWAEAPDEGVQVVVLFREPDIHKGERRWTGVDDRLLWTGTDTYDPFGWGEKRGSLVADDVYWRVWEEAKTWPKRL